MANVIKLVIPFLVIPWDHEKVISNKVPVF